MRITSSGEYALRIMVQLARHAGERPLPADRLSERDNIPRDYVDQILLRLRRAGLVVSHRGAGGGYGLALPPERVNVADVLRAVEGQVFEGVCDRYASGAQDCHHQGNCGIRSVWMRLAFLIEDFLGKITLSQLLDPEERVASLLSKAAPRALAGTFLGGEERR